MSAQGCDNVRALSTAHKTMRTNGRSDPRPMPSGRMHIGEIADQLKTDLNAAVSAEKTKSGGGTGVRACYLTVPVRTCRKERYARSPPQDAADVGIAASSKNEP